MKTAKNVALTWVLPIVIAMIVTSALLKFVIFFPRVSGHSMDETYHDGEVVAFLRPLVYGVLRRGEIVCVDEGNGVRLIKRVVALPGETVQVADGILYINGEILEDYQGAPIEDPGIAKDEIVLGDGEFFVLGDNRNHSSDSRVIGAVPSRFITGRAVVTRKMNAGE